MHLLDAKKRLEALKAKEERHKYICEFMPQLKVESLNNLWFTCIYQGQRVLKDKNKENLKSVYPYFLLSITLFLINFLFYKFHKKIFLQI